MQLSVGGTGRLNGRLRKDEIGFYSFLALTGHGKLVFALKRRQVFTRRKKPKQHFVFLGLEVEQTKVCALSFRTAWSGWWAACAWSGRVGL